jgi:subtilisin family serine protease
MAAAETAVAQLLTRHHIVPNQTALLTTGEQTSFLAHLTTGESEQLKYDPAVTMVEPDRVMSICNCVDVATTSTLLWNIQQTGYGRGDLQTTKTVWVVDTGIDLDHPDLNVDTGRSRSFVSGVTSADDQNGHGTHVAGIIGAKNNGLGVTGVASGARLVALKVLNQLGEGRLSGIIQAVNHVIQNGRPGDVVNLSLGGEGTSATLERVIRQAADAGLLFAIAAGNEGENSDN